MDTLVLSIDEAYEELQKSQKDELIKARSHKYIKREGGPGKYKYTYSASETLVRLGFKFKEQGESHGDPYAMWEKGDITVFNWGKGAGLDVLKTGHTQEAVHVDNVSGLEAAIKKVESQGGGGKSSGDAIETIKENTFEFEGRTIRLVPEKPEYSKPGFTYLKVFVDGKHFGDIDNHHSGVSGLEWSYHESAYGPEGMKYDKEGKLISPNKGIDNPYAVNYDGLEKHIRKLLGTKAQALKEARVGGKEKQSIRLPQPKIGYILKDLGFKYKGQSDKGGSPYNEWEKGDVTVFSWGSGLGYTVLKTGHRDEAINIKDVSGLAEAIKKVEGQGGETNKSILLEEPFEKARPAEHKQTWTVQRRGKMVTAHRKTQLRPHAETLRPFSSVLRQMGFKRETKDYTDWGNTHVWSKVDPESKMKIDVGLEDYKGKQSGRVSHWHMPKGELGEGRDPHDPQSYGTMSTPPTDFHTPEEMKSAISAEVKKYSSL